MKRKKHLSEGTIKTVIKILCRHRKRSHQKALNTGCIYNKNLWLMTFKIKEKKVHLIIMQNNKFQTVKKLTPQEAGYTEEEYK